MKKLTEEDVKFMYIDSAIENIGWRKSQINKEYYFTDGQIKVSGKKVRRAKGKKADYLLKSNRGEIPLAVIEAKEMKLKTYLLQLLRCWVEALKRIAQSRNRR